MQTKSVNTAKNNGSDHLPYEKFIHYGPEVLTESELLAIILRTGTRNKNALELAGEVLKRSGGYGPGILGLHHIPLKELQKIKGIGEVKAVKLKCIAELSIRISRARAKNGLLINNPGTVAAYFMEQLRHRQKECVWLLCLDAKGRISSECQISTGSVNMSVITPREIFQEALQKDAVHIILIHNHPSGDPTPSSSDKILTRDVLTAGKMLGIPLWDHIIIGDNRYLSFKEEGLL